MAVKNMNKGECLVVVAKGKELYGRLYKGLNKGNVKKMCNLIEKGISLLVV